MNEENYNTELDINLKQLFYVLVQHWWQIMLVTIIGLLLGVMYAYNSYEIKYIANSSMIVQVSDTSQSDYQNLVYGQNLVDTYSEIAKSNLVMNQLIENLELEQSASSLRSMISFSGVNNTSIIKLSVTSSNPTLSQNIANEIVYIIQNLSNEFNGLESVEVLDVAPFPPATGELNLFRYAILGAIVGGMIIVGVILFIELLDNKIKTTHDIERKVGLRVIAAIPLYTVKEIEKDAKI